MRSLTLLIFCMSLPIGAMNNVLFDQTLETILASVTQQETDPANEHLVKGASAAAQRNLGDTLAIPVPHLDACRTLVDHRFDVDTYTGIHSIEPTALIDTVDSDHLETIKLLLKDEAELNEIDSQGTTALIQAVKSNQPETIKYLLQAGADVEIRDHSNKTALHYGISGNDKIDAHSFNALITNTCIAPIQASAKEYEDAIKKITTCMLIFKSKHLPKEIQYIILIQTHESRELLVQLFKTLWQQGRRDNIPPPLRHLMVEPIFKTTIDTFKRIIGEMLAQAKPRGIGELLAPFLRVSALEEELKAAITHRLKA